MTATRSLVIPLYNEARRVPALLQALAEAADPELELVLVDDGSADGTSAALEEGARRHPGLRLRALRLEARQGKGGAVRAGLLAARGALRAFTDADLPYGLEAIEALFAALEAGADVAIGARDLAGSTVGEAPLVRRGASRLFRAWVRLVAGGLGPVRDTQCGAKAFRAASAELLFGELVRRDFAFDIEVLTLAVRLGLGIARVPVRQRAQDGSSVRLRREVPRMFLGALPAARAGLRRARQTRAGAARRDG